MLDDLIISEACLIINSRYRVRIRNHYSDSVQKGLNRIIKNNVLRIDKLGVLTVEKAPSFQYDELSSYVHGGARYTLKIYVCGDVSNASKLFLERIGFNGQL